MKTTLPLGEKIKQIRQGKGISQENMARAINSNQSFIHRFENGLVECDAKTLASIRRFLEIENAPLLEHELKLYKDRIWMWDDLMNADRTADARAMQVEMSTILDLPFEHNLSLLYLNAEARLLIKESNFSAAEEKLNEIEPMLNNASDECMHLFHRNKGFIYAFFGDYKKGLKHYLLTLEYTTNNAKPNTAIFTNMGVAYLGIGKPYHAIEFFMRAKNEYTGDRAHVIGPLANSMLATAYLIIGEYTKAKKIFEDSLIQARNVNNGPLITLTLTNMSLLKIKMGNYTESIELCDQALKYCPDKNTLSSMIISGERQGLDIICMILFNKGLALLKMKEFAQCQEVVERGLALAKGNEKFTTSFTALGHLTSLNNSSSIDYLENVAIPYFRVGSGNDKLLAVDICKELEAFYIKRRSRTKASTFVAIVRDMYEEMFIGEVDVDTHSR